MEIPGFYYDKETKKYYRITDSNREQFRLMEAQAKAREQSEQLRKNSTPNQAMQNMSKALFNHETNCHKNQRELSLPELLIKSRLNDMQLKRMSLKLSDFVGNPLTDVQCEYMTALPSKDLLYCVWRGSNGTSVHRLAAHDVISKKRPSFSEDSVSLINCFPPGNQVQDLSVYSSETDRLDSVLCLTSHVRQNTRADHCYSSLSIQFIRSNERGERCAGSGHSVRFELPGTLLSCASSRSAFAVGGRKHFRTFVQSSNVGTLTPYAGFCDEARIEIPDNATALKFSENGQFLLVGSNKGQIRVYDVARKLQLSHKASTPIGKSLVYIHALKDVNQFIVSGHDNQLLQYDLRLFKFPVLQFEGHVNSCKRAAMSVDESFQALCVPGDDNVIRYWSLTSGKLLSVVPLPSDVPPKQTQPQHCWFSTHWRASRNEPILFSSCAEKLYVYRPESI